MLAKFSVENFHSIRDRVTLDMEATAIKEHEEENIIHGHGGRYLKSVAIYGANASGKSNILKALIFMKKFIANSFKDGNHDFIRVQPFLLNTRTEIKPSLFESDFVIDGSTYRYGFEVDGAQVHKEWLQLVKVTKVVDFFRRNGQNILVDDKLFPEGKGLEKHTRQDCLFLSVIAQFNGQVSMSITKWASDIKYILDTNRNFHQNYTTKLFEKPEYNAVIKRYLSHADLGFQDIDVQKISIPTFSSFNFELGKIPGQDYKEESILLTAHPQYNENNQEIGKVLFDMQHNESLGTIKYFAMSGLIIEALIHGKLLIIDEFDSRLHPRLCESVIELFNSKVNNVHNAQLIFVSHNTSFLNKDVFRRDQVLIAKKDSYGSSTYASLADLKVRGDESYEKHYLRGDYEGIPKVKDFKLFEPR
ncbi:MAG: AAA family ATPase [Bacteroidia bacterium]